MARDATYADDLDPGGDEEVDPLFEGLEVEDHKVNDSPDEGDIGETDEIKELIAKAPKTASRPVSGLSRTHRLHARQVAVQAAFVGYRHRSVVHYTQGAARWQGINAHLIAANGHYPNYADCSSFSTWAIWNGLRVYGTRDTVNGLNWRAGYTGTMLTHGKRVRDPHNLRKGDLIIYGNGFPGRHVAMYVGGGLAVSHGSEIGPLLVNYHYRGDIMQFRRCI